ncbi:hypothetical protein [Paenibacillus sp. NFR01]|uniref:hypothetical protein n=1 Tax=Paenibacillus sp. NFR01 TaxID=1566279 RepID=UPI0008B644C3|nr:hypothetical protein [Paenibacillus sp. NFR01]SET59874.1 hypothetical protein SAMN03159358_2136 [Paenibacillus sp. NFR01]
MAPSPIGNGNSKKSGNGTSGSGNPVESQELSSEDYAIIAAGFSVLGELFAFLSLVKAKQVTEETGGAVDPLTIDPVMFVQGRKKAAKRRRLRSQR